MACSNRVFDRATSVDVDSDDTRSKNTCSKEECLPVQLWQSYPPFLSTDLPSPSCKNSMSVRDCQRLDSALRDAFIASFLDLNRDRSRSMREAARLSSDSDRWASISDLAVVGKLFSWRIVHTYGGAF